jgi:FkbM family methyltransferase
MTDPAETLQSGVLRANARPILSDPGDRQAVLGAMQQISWDCAPERVAAWSRHLEALSGGDPNHGGRQWVFGQRLLAGAELRRSMLRPVKEVHVIRTPVGPIQLSADDKTGKIFRHRLLIDGAAHEPGVVAYLCHRLKPGSVFVDVGAHVGYFSCIAGKAGATVLALEMQRPLGGLIVRNAELNGLDRIHALEMAAGDHDGLIRVPRFDAGLGTRVLEGTKEDRRSSPSIRHRNMDLVPMMRLDSLFSDGAERPDVVKIDAEGFELCVLDGAERLIADHRSAFIVEVHIGQMAIYPSRRPTLADYFPLDRWRVRDLTIKGAPEMEEAVLRRLTDPDCPQTGNPNLLFEPV